MKNWYDGLTKGKKMLVWVAAVIVVGFIGDAAGWWEMTSFIPGGDGPDGA